MRKLMLLAMVTVACILAARFTTRVTAQNAPVGEFQELFNGKDLTEESKGSEESESKGSGRFFVKKKKRLPIFPPTDQP